MKSILCIFAALIFYSGIATAQSEYNYTYKVYEPYSSGNGRWALIGGYYGYNKSISEILSENNTYHLVTLIPGNVLIMEHANRTDGKTITEAIAAAKADLENKINSVTDVKINEAVSKLRHQLIEAMKDAKLYDETYKSAIVESAVSQFRVELTKAIKEVTSQIKK